MLKLVRGQNNVVSLRINATYPVGEVSGNFVAKSVTVAVPKSRNGTEFTLTAANLAAIDEDFLIGVMTLKNESNEEVAKVRVPMALLPAGSDNRGFTEIRITLVSIKETEGEGHGGSGVKIYPTKDDFPPIGNIKYIYLAEDTGKMYRWDAVNAQYVEVSGVVHANLAETDASKDSFVLNKETQYLFNDGHDGIHPYVTVANFVPDYNAETTYHLGDVVFHTYLVGETVDNGVFRCKVATAANPPPTASDWDEIDLYDLIKKEVIVTNVSGVTPTGNEELWVDETEIPSGQSYNDLIDKPQVNGHELTGNKTSAQLGVADATDIDKIVYYGYLYNGKFYKEAAHATEIPGAINRLYVDVSTERTYRWNAATSTYVSLTSPVDSAIDPESENPVQNKVISEALAGKATPNDITSAIGTHNSATDAHSDIRTAVGNKYTKPSGGIPSVDIANGAIGTTQLASGVVDSLGKADSAVQPSAIANMQTTTNLKTTLADNSDSYYPSQKAVKTAVDGKANVADLAGKLSDSTADFSPSSTYEVGDFCKYDGALYVCKTAITTAGAWDAAKWTAMPNSEALFGTGDEALKNTIVATVPMTALRATSDPEEYELRPGAADPWDGKLDTLSEAANWNAATTYAIGDFCTYQAYSYVAIAATTGNIPSSSPTYWKQASLANQFSGLNKALTDVCKEYGGTTIGYDSTTGRYYFDT